MRTCPRCQRTYPDDMDFCSRDGTPLPASAPATEADLAAGLARRYRIVRRLAAGGMGAVFLAEQVALGNRPVALKVLLRKLLDDPEFLERFHNEAASTARIRHANVITVYESGQSDDSSPYIAMEFLEGETLRQALKRRGAFPVAETSEILQQVARGLNAAHKLGIIHRDLKPDNIFLTRADEGELAVKVMDFGIAKLRESATHTLTGTVLGTPAYMSFEQASGMKSEELDLRSDIYSLGVVVYEMLTGRVPFHSDTPLGYVRKHMMEEPPPFRAVAPGLPVAPEVERAVMRALKKDREERYPSALEFARDLAAAAQETLPSVTRESRASTEVLRRPAASPRADAPARVRARSDPDVAVQTPPPIPPRETAKPVPAPPQAVKPAPAGSRQPVVARPPQFQVAAEQASRVKFVVLGLLLVAVIIAGFWYFLGRGERQQPSTTSQPTETSKPAETIKPTTQPAPGQQGTTVQASPETSGGQSSVAQGTNAADRRKQIEAAKKQGDTYYDNGDYNHAIAAYQSGLKLAPSDNQLLKALRRAQSAKAAEEKFNQ